MLNESHTHKHAPSATQPSPPQGAQYGTPQSNHRAPNLHAVDPRSTPSQPTPIYPPDPRSPGSYFPTQSPYSHNSASTPVANGGQWHAQSPAIQGGQYNTFYGNPPLQSPGPPSSSQSSPRPPGWYDQQYHSRQNSVGLTGLPSQPRNAIPNTPLHNQPGTPLGPPAPYSRPSPQTPRPLSKGMSTTELILLAPLDLTWAKNIVWEESQHLRNNQHTRLPLPGIRWSGKGKEAKV
jgi:hypothetical protein